MWIMDNKKHFFTTPNPFEKQFGYHRAVRKGTFIIVSGTTAAKMDGDEIDDPDEKKDSGVHFPKNAKKQAKLAMDRCAEAVEKLGGTRADVVRVRMFVAVSPMALLPCDLLDT
jgi:enamine deaminase RidA (YjgF/YER057c/UK114 family)